MKQTESLFLAAVVLFAGLFCAVSVMNTGTIMKRKATSQHLVTGAAGKARDVDVHALERLMQQGYLSDREAEFYKKVTKFPSDGQEAEPRKAPAEAIQSEKPVGQDN